VFAGEASVAVFAVFAVFAGVAFGAVARIRT